MCHIALLLVIAVSLHTDEALHHDMGRKIKMLTWQSSEEDVKN
ncbi:hypothetical protein PSYJA_14222 [Pseudomonas syringae pv. japonica str. M301072]|uniref:Uncharacterized protein n=1 Tax=Pseudomonas syringae pv. japonica str. M301072 TaxID=629262 RepID=F3FIM3_PSESX|nr:hypothetical protein PSYJA_14222 [Pseudomonas syringae pv. japonica str. M301072]